MADFDKIQKLEKLKKLIAIRLWTVYAIDLYDLENTWPYNLPIYDRYLFLLGEKYNALV